ncbi:3-ketosteroid 9alpha-monooxygenase subunit B [Pseudomonas sp. ok272]|uniref:ferredoxin--NADP reductase n=1 Tax=unclassified Pseudomonas TaxID=196821 RepID=UPI0008C597D4|nr:MULTISPECIES: ferredoxin--NADP reductase [unclassified Pseudomonas]SEN43276.1 3-ketosteroid 9alpha-monooxygenase subunit B [Pseudomonas sp. ok272]SFN25154.1 3-ketosteroid 9alpha-monooxygenase subunit B [Pseudomonas sp. ok602]
MSTSLYHHLQVVEVIEETHDSKSIVFASPAQPRAFAYKPGQFLTLRIPVQGRSIARCYSLASAPAVDGALKVTVKRVRDGLGSNWIWNNLRAGDTLEVLPPAGVFCPVSLDVDFLMFAGGSGITPMMSIIKSCLHQGSGRVYLFYANRDERSVIFADELQQLARAYPQRLTVMHWLESVQGLPTSAQLAGLCRGQSDAHAFVCGPGPFMDAVEQTLLAQNVARSRIHIERFVSLSSDPGVLADAPLVAADGPQVELMAQLDGERHALAWNPAVDLLDALLGAGVGAPFSCREGRCSACMCRVTEGEVSMRSNEVLSAADLAGGWVLSCQARPISDKVSISFDG